MRLPIGSSFSGSLKCTILRIFNRLKIVVAKVCCLVQYIWYSAFCIALSLGKLQNITIFYLYSRDERHYDVSQPRSLWDGLMFSGYSSLNCRIMYNYICIFIRKTHNIFNKFICNKFF